MKSCKRCTYKKWTMCDKVSCEKYGTRYEKKPKPVKCDTYENMNAAIEYRRGYEVAENMRSIEIYDDYRE